MHTLCVCVCVWGGGVDRHNRENEGKQRTDWYLRMGLIIKNKDRLRMYTVVFL